MQKYLDWLAKQPASLLLFVGGFIACALSALGNVQKISIQLDAPGRLVLGVLGLVCMALAVILYRDTDNIRSAESYDIRFTFPTRDQVVTADQLKVTGTFRN